jgi:hypothetical protein
MLLFEKTAVEFLKSLEHVALDMDKVSNAEGLEVVSASGCTGNNKFCFAIEELEGFGSKFGIFVI